MFAFKDIDVGDLFIEFADIGPEPDFNDIDTTIHYVLRKNDESLMFLSTRTRRVWERFASEGSFGGNGPWKCKLIKRAKRNAHQ